MSLIDELFEDKGENKKIVKTLKPKKELSPDIFEKKGSYYIMRPDVRKKLIEAADDFINTFGVEFFIHDIILTGSLANFNWSKYSDADLHILLDMDEFGEESKDEILLRSIFKEFFDAKKVIWNSKRDIKVKGFDVEVYVQDIQEKHISSGVYSILHNSWIIEPRREQPQIDDRKIVNKAEEISKKIDDIIDIKDKQKALNAIESYKTKIKKFRQCGLESGGEYSYENLTFKLLRRNGEIARLLDFKKDIVNSKLSLNESPDYVKKAQLSWNDKDGFTFGIIDGKMLIGLNVKWLPNDLYKQMQEKFVYPNRIVSHYRAASILAPSNAGSIHPEIPSFYTMLYELGRESKKIDFEPLRTHEGFTRSMFKYPGRLFLTKKIVSFWRNPKSKTELYHILEMFVEEFNKIYTNKPISMDFLKDFKIEVADFDETIFDDDLMEEDLIPISEFKGSADVSKEKFEAPHTKSWEEKKTDPQMLAAKSSDIKFNSKKEKGWDSLVRRNFLLKKDIAEMVLKETPDFVRIDNDEGIGYAVRDAIPFGVFDGVMVIGYNQELFSDELRQRFNKKFDTGKRYSYNDTPILKDILDKNIGGVISGPNYHGENLSFYQALYELGIEKVDLDLERKYKEGRIKKWRTDFTYAGRLWFKHKIISFWDYPETKTKLDELLNEINYHMNLIYGVTLDFENYKIEINTGNKIKDEWDMNYDEYKLIPISEYVGSKEVNKKDLEAIHTLPPEQKSKTKQMLNVKSSDIKFNSEKEKGWDSLAKRNFILKKDVAENDE